MLKNRNFLALWVVNVLTTLALELFTVTILVTVFEQTGSTLQTAGVMVARMLPAFVLGPVAGVLVDRVSRKSAVMTMDGVRFALVTVAIWLLNSTGSEALPVWAIYLILTGLSAADTFHRPARLALIPSFVGRNELVQANSFIMGTVQIVMAVSYTVGGWLILAVSLQQVAFMIAGMLAAAVATAALMQVPDKMDRSGVAGEESIWASFQTGWRYLSAHPIARPLTIMETAEHVPHGIWTGALMLAFTQQALGGNSIDWGYQVTGYFSGMIAGSVVALTLSGWLSRYPGWIIIVNALAAGFMTIAYAGSQAVGLAVVLAFIFGPPMAIRDVAQDALLQSSIEDDQLGRVYATREMLRNAVFVISGLGFAWLSDLYSIRWIYVSGGVLYLLTGLYALSSRPLRQSQIKDRVGVNL